MRKRDTRKTAEENQQELAYDQLAEQYAQELKAFKEGEGQAEMDAFFARHEARHLNAIQRAFQKRSWLDAVLPAVPRLAKVAALVIACVTLAGGAALAVGGTLRVSVMRLELEETKDYTALSLVEDEEASFDVPAEWKGRYYLSYIPEGMTLTQIFDDGYVDGYRTVEYFNEPERSLKIDYTEGGSGTTANIDTENAEIRSMTIQGYEGHMVIKNDSFHFYWTDGQAMYILLTKGFDEETALQILSGLQRL